jgi:hypothetical protein
VQVVDSSLSVNGGTVASDIVTGDGGFSYNAARSYNGSRNHDQDSDTIKLTIY